MPGDQIQPHPIFNATRAALAYAIAGCFPLFFRDDLRKLEEPSANQDELYHVKQAGSPQEEATYRWHACLSPSCSGFTLPLCLSTLNTRTCTRRISGDD